MTSMDLTVEHITATEDHRKLRLENAPKAAAELLIRYEDGSGGYSTALRTTRADAKRLAYALLLFSESH